MKSNRKILTFLAAVLLPVLVGGIGAVATRASVSTWYQRLKKPKWTPPDWVFGPVWTILYILMGIASWLVWRKKDSKPEAVRHALGWYGLQLGLNALWSFIFFRMRKIGLALIEIVTLETALTATILKFSRLSRRAAWLLLPYYLWVGFATALNATLWWLNEEHSSVVRWKSSLTRLAYNLEIRLDELKYRLRKRLGRLGPLQLVAYRGHGTGEDFFLRGRVQKDKGLKPASERDTLWQNFVAMYQRFESDEIPYVRVQVEFQNARQERVSDREGYFSVHLKPTVPLSTDRVWHEVTLRVMDDIIPDQEDIVTTGHVLVPPPTSDFGVISDIDDTIVKTHATNLLKMAWITFFNNANTRLPFKGVAGFYRALCRGVGNHPARNPIFYVSGSPWNLYDLLVDFMDVQDIPLGPLFLRDFGFETNKFIKVSTAVHKLTQIEHILNTHSNLPFILIGDSGQKDPEIYRQVVQDFPGRIKAIYIRDVTLANPDQEINLIIEELGAQDVPMLLVPDTLAAAEHAVEQDFISPEALRDIQTETLKDEKAPGELEQLLEQV